MSGRFPDDYDPGTDRVRRVWDLSGLLPMPLYQLRCPTCGMGEMAVKDWKLHTREHVGSREPWRCDVRMKCMTCGYVPTFGVLVPKPMFDKARKVFGRPGTWIHWRVGRDKMREEAA